MDNLKLKKTGTVLIHDGRIYVDGFRADGATCRDVAGLAMLWAIGVLQKDLVALNAKPGGGNSCIDLPAGVWKALYPGKSRYIGFAGSDEG